MSWASGFRKFLVVLNVITALLLLGACYIAFYPVSTLTFLDAFGIMVPLLVVINLVILFFWLFTRRWYALISTFPLLIGFLCFGSIYQFRLSSNSDFQNDISIMSYNVKGFGLKSLNKDLNEESKAILNFIKKQDPDIICIQEFRRAVVRELKQYPYHYNTSYRSNKTEQAIFSKYPIINSGSLNFPQSTNNAIFSDIVLGKDTLRVYNIHLQSYFIYSFRSLIKKNAGKGLLKRILHTTFKHREQVEILKAHKNTSPYPVVISGDFNQPQFSPSFKNLSKDMTDSFMEAGKGWGTTFKRNVITARIDFILADDEAFEVLDHQNFDFNKSDHLPIMARLKYLSD